MDRKSRGYRVLRWASLALFALVVLAWGVSTQYSLFYVNPRLRLGIEAGWLVVSRIPESDRDQAWLCARPPAYRHRVLGSPWEILGKGFLRPDDVAKSEAVFYQSEFFEHGAFVDEQGNGLAVSSVPAQYANPRLKNVLVEYTDGRKKVVCDYPWPEELIDDDGGLVPGILMTPQAQEPEQCVVFERWHEISVRFWPLMAVTAAPTLFIWRREFAGLAGQLVGRSRRKSRVRLASKWAGVMMILLTLVVWAFTYEWDISCGRTCRRPAVTCALWSDFGGLFVGWVSTGLSPEGMEQLLRDEAGSSSSPRADWRWHTEKVVLSLSVGRPAPPAFPKSYRVVHRNPCASGCAYGHGDACLVKGAMFRETALWVPFWLPLLLEAFTAAWLFWRDRLPAKGPCRECGYDLTGNTTGRCPECGLEIAG